MVVQAHDEGGGVIVDAGEQAEREQGDGAVRPGAIERGKEVGRVARLEVAQLVARHQQLGR